MGLLAVGLAGGVLLSGGDRQAQPEGQAPTRQPAPAEVAPQEEVGRLDVAVADPAPQPATETTAPEPQPGPPVHAEPTEASPAPASNALRVKTLQELEEVWTEHYLEDLIPPGAGAPPPARLERFRETARRRAVVTARAQHAITRIALAETEDLDAATRQRVVEEVLVGLLERLQPAFARGEPTDEELRRFVRPEVARCRAIYVR